MVHILQELIGYRAIDGVEQCSFFIENKIGVVSYPMRKREKVFKSFNPPITGAYPYDVLSNISCIVQGFILQNDTYILCLISMTNILTKGEMEKRCTQFNFEDLGIHLLLSVKTHSI